RRRPGGSRRRARPGPSLGHLLLGVHVGLVAGLEPAAAPELRDERRALEAEEPGGRLLVAFRAAERLLDQPVLEFLDGAVQVEALVAERRTGNLLLGDERADARRQVLELDVPVLGEDHEA